MEKILVNDHGEGQIMESLNRLSMDRAACTDDRFHLCKSKSKKLAQLGNQDCTLAFMDSCCENASSLGSHISKHIVSVDERYLRHCMELIYHGASKAAIYGLPSKTSSKMGILSGTLKSPKIASKDALDLPAFGLDCSLLAGPTGNPIVGSIMRSKSMANLLRSPLLRKYGDLDNKSNYGNDSNDLESSMFHDLVSSQRNSSMYRPRKLEYDTSSERIQKCRPKFSHERMFSTSSSNSSSSDQTSSSASFAASQGMLQCTWKGGNPLFVFSLDDQKEVYYARSSKIETAKENDMDCMYLIYSKDVGHLEHESYNKESHLIGKVKVSSSFTLCPCNSKIRETEFVLFGGIDNSVREVPVPTRFRRNYSGIPKKIVEAFRTSPSFKLRSVSRISGKSVVPEDSSYERLQNSCSNTESQSINNLLDNNLPANYQLAAIVLKDHVPEKPLEKAAGWGLKFLRKGNRKQDTDRLKPLVSSQCRVQTSGDCSTSMDILIPAGIHGGPIMKNGGPSSLIKRWKSGGQCECGGWDQGCPLTILTTSSSKEEIPSQAYSHGECKSFDLFIKGSNDGSPTLRMAIVHDGLYVIHFQSALSALQSLSIAIAYCHSRNSSKQSESCTAMT